ncbi:MAG: pilus assembly protein [Pseudobdellovibrio sp.]
MLLKQLRVFLILFIFLSQNIFAQSTPAANSNTSTTPNTPKYQYEEVVEGGGVNVKLLQGEPNKRRIRRSLNLIAGVKHDEEFLIPEVPLSYQGNTDLINMLRIKGTDIFRILPTKVGNGIITVHNKETGQILLELRVDIRDQGVEKVVREMKALLSDIEGIEYKIVNNKVVLDGFVLLPKDLKRVGQVVGQFKGGSPDVSSLVTLSPLAKKKIVEYIERDINNPEVQITAIGDYIRLEGFVNTPAEKTRILNIVTLYLPDMVSEKGQANLDNIDYIDRKKQPAASDYIIDNITVRPEEEKQEPPPKMIQVVTHVVEYSERYLKSFNFTFSPTLSTLGDAQSMQQGQAPGSISEMASVINNLLPKLNWARNHGYIRLLDTASILVQDTKPGSLNRTLGLSNGQAAVASQQGGGGGGGNQQNAGTQTSTITLNVTPTIKQARSELVELAISASTETNSGGLSFAPRTSVNTTVSVRSRQSAALAGIITKKSENQFGGPTGAGAIFTLNHGKSFIKNSSNYVLFVTPIVKSSASSGVEQVKKKFRMRE